MSRIPFKIVSKNVGLNITKKESRLHILEEHLRKKSEEQTIKKRMRECREKGTLIHLVGLQNCKTANHSGQFLEKMTENLARGTMIPRFVTCSKNLT